MAQLGKALITTKFSDEELTRLLSFANSMARAPKLTQKAALSIFRHMRCSGNLKDAMRFLVKISTHSQVKNYRKRANNLVRKSRRGTGKEAAGLALQWALDSVEKVMK